MQQFEIMFDVALSSAGAQVVLATSSDENNAPENIIDGNSDTFWSTTGMFPQEFVISFQSLMNLNSVRLMSYGVKQLLVERSVQNDPNDFEVIGEKIFEATDGRLQEEEIPASNLTATHLRFTISSAYDHFCSVHKVHVDGNAVH